MVFGDRVRSTMPVDSTQMTKQAPADQQRVSEILKRYVNMGMVPSNGVQPTYGDFTGVGDFHECLERVRRAQADFMLMPAKVRQVAENDPGLFLEMFFGGRPEILAELEAAGMLAVHRPVVTPPVVPGDPAPPA